MVSGDTAVHVAVVVVTVALFGAAPLLGLGPDSPATRAAGFVVFYGLVLGGSHLVLAARGEGGPVPVSSRWRFLGALAVVLVLVAVAILTDPVALGPVSSRTAIAVGIVATMAGYWLLEARDGYRESAGQTT